MRYSIELKQNIQNSMASKPKQKSRKKIESGELQKQGPWWFLGESALGQRFNALVDGAAYTVVSTVIMLYTLFSDDVREIFFPMSADEGFSDITLLCMVYYTLEIVAFSLFQKDYFLQYYFWLDIISTATMCLDLVWVSQYITGGGKSAANISQISRASRAARLGTRTVRLVRLVRMIKIMKQMKLLSKDLARKDEPPTKPSQRLSSIQSRLTSLRNIERMSAHRHSEKLPSKRWSLIKETGCMNVLGAAKEGQISINCLPYKEPDAIVDSEAASKHHPHSMRSVEAPPVPPKQPSIYRIEDSKNKVVVLENIEEEGEEKGEKGENGLEGSKFKSKRSRFDQTNREIGEQTSDEEIVVPPESKVGSRVQSEIQKNVILMIILILVSIPLLDGSTWYSALAVYDRGINDLAFFARTDAALYHTEAPLFIADASDFLNPLAYFIVSTPLLNDTYPDNYQSASLSSTAAAIIANTRTSDLDVYQGDGYSVGFDISWYNKQVSMMNIGRTLFVCILLIIATMMFSNDLQFAAIAPLEEMFETVKKIAIHPLNALREIEEKNLCLEGIDDDNGLPNTEPKLLQNTIVKIGSLLAVGFGEAGTEIICRVIEDPAIIDVMIPGQKIMALFGFCDIRNFTDATEVLQADVMVFVNEIAAICHRVTYEHLGSPNKNIGDAFLLVWKFAQSDCKVVESAEETSIELLRTPRVSQQADLAVLALVKMIADITKAHNLQKYKQNKGLQERIPNYNGVKMGFGLHVGWAIEGPIGSEYKIDASYLGSHVHMASRLEAATKGYGASMLITGEVYELMSKNRTNLRHIDRVVPTGETAHTDLYTVDIVPKHLFDELGVRQEKALNEKERKVAKVCQNIARKKLSEDILKEGATDALWNDEDIRIMQEPYSPRFYEEWRKGFKNYLEGRWEQALQELTGARALGPNGSDGPTESIIKYIEEHNGRAPEDWAGHRDFD